MEENWCSTRYGTWSFLFFVYINNVKAKARIYKTAIRPILTYAAETRPETSKTKRILETAEIKSSKNSGKNTNG